MEHSRFKKGFVISIVAVLLIVSSGYQAIGSEFRRGGVEKGGPDPGVMVADTLAARPVGFAALLTGTVIFTVSLPFSILGGNTGEAFEKLVKDPARYTFVRPLGNFEAYPGLLTGQSWQDEKAFTPY